MTRILTAAIFAVPMAYASPVAAATCGPRDTMVMALASKFGEARKTVALDGRKNMVETFANDATGTWTVTLTRPNGTACIVAAGKNFEMVDEAVPNQES